MGEDLVWVPPCQKLILVAWVLEHPAWFETLIIMRSFGFLPSESQIDHVPSAVDFAPAPKSLSSRRKRIRQQYMLRKTWG